MQRCVSRTAGAADELVERFGRLVYAVILRTLERHGARRDDDRVSELFSGTFVRLLDAEAHRLAAWDGRCTLASWVRIVASSLTIDRLREEARDQRRWADGVAIERLPAETPTTVELAVRAEQLVRLERALTTLSPSDRELLRLLFEGDLAPGAVAERLGLTAGALYTRKNRALQRLRSAMGEAEVDEV